MIVPRAVPELRPGHGQPEGAYPPGTQTSPLRFLATVSRRRLRRLTTMVPLWDRSAVAE